MAGFAHCAPVGGTDRSSQDGSIVVGLAGNPNTGKSSIFNFLTGAKQHVANWPGKTVSKAHGKLVHRGIDVEVVDLPGTYSLNVASPEEMIARDFLIHDQPDAVIVVVDASNLERNLYLVVQVLEMGVPTVVALNMTDVADSREISVDVNELAELLGVPVIPTVARRGRGLESLKDELAATITAGRICDRRARGSDRRNPSDCRGVSAALAGNRAH
jgi:ferrous iron transport protein B